MGLCVIALACASLVAATHASAKAACTPGGTNAVRTYCGPATATLRVGGTKYSFHEGGKCSISGSSWKLDIGTVTLNGKPKHAYFGIATFGKKPGKNSAAVTWQLRGKTASLNNAWVTLARGLKKGTFIGKVGRRIAKGSFSCK